MTSGDDRFTGNPQHFFGGDKKFPKGPHLGSWNALKQANPRSSERVGTVKPHEVLIASQGNHDRQVTATYRAGGDGPHADTPVKVFQHTTTGRKHVINGHHRILADRTHGKATPVIYLGGGVLPGADSGAGGDSAAPAPAAATATVATAAVYVDEFGIVKEIKKAWAEAMHPRDKNGRFIVKGADVQLGDGSTGKVVGGKKLKNGAEAITVKRDNGTTAVVKPDSLTVRQKAPGQYGRVRIIHSNPKVPATDLIKSIKDNGGFTYDPRTGGLLVPGKDKGIAVAVPGTEQIVGSGDKVSAHDFAKGVQKVIQQHRTQIANGAKLGGWYSEDRKAYMVELTDLLPGDTKQQRDAAIAEGTKRNQEGIFDIGGNEYIPTGGTGDAAKHEAEANVPNAPNPADAVPGAPPAKKPKVLDTPSSKYGMTFNQKAADNPLVQKLKADDAAWANVPTTDYALPGHQDVSTKLVATEPMLQSKPIDKVVGGEPFRAGYDPKILKTDSGDVVIDGHHRVAMHTALGHSSMPAKVIDARSGTDLNTSLGGPGALNDASPQANETAAGILAAARKNEPAVTSIVTRLASDNGAQMTGLDNRLKTQDSLANKLDTKSAKKGMTIQAYGAKIGDALRYTMLAPQENYSQTANNTLAEFQRQGYKVSDVSNTWNTPDTTYKGLNTNITAPDGTTFELQFHTPQSIEVKNNQHKLYEIERDPKQTPEARAAAHTTMVANAAAIANPAGAGDISMQSVNAPSAPTPANAPPPAPTAPLIPPGTKLDPQGLMDIAKANPITPATPGANPVGKDFRNMSGSQKIAAVAMMYGIGSKQYAQAVKKWGKKGVGGTVG